MSYQLIGSKECLNIQSKLQFDKLKIECYSSQSLKNRIYIQPNALTQTSCSVEQTREIERAKHVCIA